MGCVYSEINPSVMQVKLKSSYLSSAKYELQRLKGCFEIFVWTANRDRATECFGYLQVWRGDGDAEDTEQNGAGRRLRAAGGAAAAGGGCAARGHRCPCILRRNSRMVPVQ